MTREEAKNQIHADWEELIFNITDLALTQTDRNHESYVCPICGHGKGGDGMLVNPDSKTGYGLKCFGCGFSGDIIDLYEKANGVDYNKALEDLAAMDGITIDAYQPSSRSYSYTDALADFPAQEPTEAPKNAPVSPPAPAPVNSSAREEKPTQRTETAAHDLSEYYRECQARLTDPAAVSYLTARGISIETAAAHGLGFDPQADPAGSGHPTPRIISPTSPSHYVGRSIDPNTPKEYRKMNNKGGKVDIFNYAVLYAQEAQEVFVVEGIFDALSIAEIGSAAVALNSTSNVNLLLKHLQERTTEATIIVCLDNDEAGQKAAKELREGLRRLNISFISADTARLCAGHKDANEALTADREAFRSAVNEALHMASDRPDNTAYYIDNLMGDDLEKFRDNIKTGFYNLDEIIGGLYSGLYCLAAISSLGKTTFAVQLADQIAAAGRDVLYFSLEQSRLEMITKSISRITAETDPKKGVTDLAIRRGYFPPSVKQAMQTYKERVNNRVSIIEGNFNPTISFIGDYIRQYIRRTDTRPVVFLDYLQIIQPDTTDGKKQTTKDAVDETVRVLKQITRDLGITVFMISSVNRANYMTPISFESLKESGGIEYTCDVVWGLQLHCLSDDLFSKEGCVKQKREVLAKAKKENPRKIDLECLKNRYGTSSFECGFEYFADCNLFKAKPNPKEQPTATPTAARYGRR